MADLGVSWLSPLREGARKGALFLCRIYRGGNRLSGGGLSKSPSSGRHSLDEVAMRFYDEDDRVPVFDDEPEDLVHPDPVAYCGGSRISQDCFCPAVRPLTQTVSKHPGIGQLVSVQLCICCGGVPR